MAYYVDSAGENPHVNYEPSSEGGLEEAQPHTRDYYQYVEGHVMRHELLRTQDDYKQAGERYRSFEEWERDDLLNNLANDLKQCPEEIALRMVWHFSHCDEDYGREVARRAGLDLGKALALPALPKKFHPGPVARSVNCV
jgi:catalase